MQLLEVIRQKSLDTETLNFLIMIKIIEYENINHDDWERLLYISSYSSYFQSPECYEFYKQLSFLEPFVYAVKDDEKLVGLACGYLISDGLLLKKHLSRRAIIPGGLLLDNSISEDSVVALLTEIKLTLRQKVIYIEIRNYNDYSLFKDSFIRGGFSYHAHLNFHLSTSNTENALKNLSSTKRRDIKLSLKEGATIQQSATKQELISLYNILKSLYTEKIKTPLFPLEFFLKLYETEQGKIFTVKFKGEIVGGSICVCYDKKTLYEWFVCGKDGKYKNIFPSTLATWAAIEFATQNGFERFDMMGAGKPDEGYGVREFKAKFGGNLVQHGRFLCILSKNQYKLGSYIIKKIRNRNNQKKTIETSAISKIKIVSDISNINTDEWSAFVLRHPHGNIFQSPEIYSVYNQTPKHKPTILIAYENGKISGCLLSVATQQYKGILKVLSSRVIVYGGPLVDNNNEKVASELLVQHFKIVKNEGVLTQFRNSYNMLPLNEVFRKNLYLFESHLNIIVDLSKGIDKLWQELHDGRKKKVKNALNSGLSVEVYENNISQEQIHRGYEIIKKVYESAELPLASVILLIQAAQTGTLILFELKYREQTIGVRFVLKYKDILYGWYAGSLSKHYSLFPNDLLIWETIKWGVENKYRLFDYGGAGNPNADYGVRKFKLQTGGEIVNFGRYELVHKPLAFFFAKLGFRLWKIINKNK